MCELGIVNKWTLTLDDSIDLEAIDDLEDITEQYEMKVEGFIDAYDSSIAFMNDLKGKDILFVLPPTWWQWIVPVRHIYKMRNVSCTFCDDSGKIMVSGNCDENPTLKWHCPTWIRRIFRRRIDGEKE